MNEKKHLLSPVKKLLFVASTELEKLGLGGINFLFISSQTEVQYFSVFLQFCTIPKENKEEGAWGCFFQTGFNFLLVAVKIHIGK